MAKRQHAHELVSAVATCDRCTFNVRGNNAQALAALHHDQKGHRTHVDITTRITYGANLGKIAKGHGQGSLKL